MRPLTDACPKPLLPVAGKPLIVWQIERLVAAGISEIVINHAHLGAQIEAALGDGTCFGAMIAYSPEPPGALETAGGIRHALPLLGSEPFLVVNGDVWCDWDIARAPRRELDERLAHLVLTDNPPHHPDGDFALAGDAVRWSENRGGERWLTFTGIGIYRPELFAALPDQTPHKLRYPLREAAARGLVSGEYFSGRWEDIGTPERLAALDRELAQ
jgi:MurNAc alpha-1-phosphate uridylyltransferase